jgi:CrcB protein
MNYLSLSLSIGAGLGANARYVLGGWLADRFGASFPWSTLIVNASGSLAIGIVPGMESERVTPEWWRPGLAIGFLGSYTTFSTFSYETINLLRDGSYLAAAGNIGGSVAAVIVAVSVGLAIAQFV